ncbi:hypothetical protein IJ182_10550 [bacterium]|nr:hypothetical protein [bacterium]
MPYDEAIEFIKGNCQNKDVVGDVDLDNISEYEIADLLWKYHGNLVKYELQNDTFESTIDETKIYKTQLLPLREAKRLQQLKKNRLL